MKDWQIKALKTFVEAAGSFIVADLAVLGDALCDWSTGKHALISLLVGAVAAGFSAAWNIVLEKLNK